MKKILPILLIFFSFGAYTQSPEADTGKICWSDSAEIEWADFQAPPQEGKKIAALSSIGLPYNYNSDGEGEMIVSVDVCFIKADSWAIPEQQNNLLLTHERLHFAIAELYRRKIIKEILDAEFTKKNYKQKLDAIVERHWVYDYRDAQNEYDKETNFSRVVKAQIEWNQKIEEELKAHEAYTQKEVKVSLINFD